MKLLLGIALFIVLPVAASSAADDESIVYFGPEATPDEEDDGLVSLIVMYCYREDGAARAVCSIKNQTPVAVAYFADLSEVHGRPTPRIDVFDIVFEDGKAFPVVPSFVVCDIPSILDSDKKRPRTSGHRVLLEIPEYVEKRIRTARGEWQIGERFLFRVGYANLDGIEDRILAGSVESEFVSFRDFRKEEEPRSEGPSEPKGGAEGVND